MAAARGLHGDPAQARRDSPDPGRRHDGRLHLAAIFPRRAGRRLLEVLLYTQYSTVRAYSAQPMAWSYMHRVTQLRHMQSTACCLPCTRPRACDAMPGWLDAVH